MCQSLNLRYKIEIKGNKWTIFMSHKSLSNNRIWDIVSKFHKLNRTMVTFECYSYLTRKQSLWFLTSKNLPRKSIILFFSCMTSSLLSYFMFSYLASAYKEWPAMLFDKDSCSFNLYLSPIFKKIPLLTSEFTPS